MTNKAEDIMKYTICCKNGKNTYSLPKPNFLDGTIFKLFYFKDNEMAHSLSFFQNNLFTGGVENFQSDLA